MSNIVCPVLGNHRKRVPQRERGTRAGACRTKLRVKNTEKLDVENGSVYEKDDFLSAIREMGITKDLGGEKN